jgi:hypothetical protein
MSDQIKVIWRASKGTFVVRWLDPSTGTWREQSAKSDDRKKADRLAGKITEQLATENVQQDRCQLAQSTLNRRVAISPFSPPEIDGDPSSSSKSMPLGVVAKVVMLSE